MLLKSGGRVSFAMECFMKIYYKCQIMYKSCLQILGLKSKEWYIKCKERERDKSCIYGPGDKDR